MKLVIMTLGSMGDVRPYVALGQGLLQAGFDVCIATHPEFESFIRSNGLDFRVIRGNPREVLESPEGQALLQSGTNILKFANYMKTAATDILPQAYDDCLAATEGADALVLSFLAAGIGGLIAKTKNIKTILAFLQPLTPTGAFASLAIPNLYLGGMLNYWSHTLVRDIFWNVFWESLNTWSQDRLGVKAPRKSLYKWLEKHSLVLYGYSRMLVPRPMDWPNHIHVTGYWGLNAGSDYQPSAELNDFLAAGDKPIYIGFGSMNSPNVEQVSQWIATALKQSGQRAILLKGWGGISESISNDQAMMLDKVPHDWLFPHMAAVIHHGGAGTTHAGLWSGVPSVALPFFGDQDFWGQRLFGMGCGPRPVKQSQLDANKLTHLIQALIKQPNYSKRSQELSQRMRSEGGVKEAVSLIERFTRV